MFTPISTASTAGGPLTRGSSTRTAGRLLTAFDSTAASAAMPSRAASPLPAGRRSRAALSRPLTMTALTTTASARTNRQNGRFSERVMPPIVLRRCASERTPSTTAPVSAAQAGDQPANDVTAKPAKVSPNTTSTNTGRSPPGGLVPPGVSARSRRNTSRSTAYSAATANSHGAAISALNRVNDRPAAPNASRLVRFDTGNNSEAVFDRCAVA